VLPKNYIISEIFKRIKEQIYLDTIEDQKNYCSTADLTSSLEIFPPTPEARSKAPVFDIV
jgi:hypothetical protein